MSPAAAVRAVEYIEEIMSFDDKLAQALEELESKKVGRYRTAPLLPMSARIIGLKIRPAHYRSFLSNLIFYSSIFGFFMVAPLLIFNWNELSWLYMKEDVLLPLLLSVLFGLVLAIYCARSARSNLLTPWDKL